MRQGQNAVKMCQYANEPILNRDSFDGSRGGPFLLGPLFTAEAI